MRVLKIPSSKSYTIRALYSSLFAESMTTIDNYLPCNDTDAMVQAMHAFGVHVKRCSTKLIVYPPEAFKVPKMAIDAKNSGLVFRFMTAFSALFDQEIIITGDESIQKRRIIKPLVLALRQGGARVDFLNPPLHAPVCIKGPIHAGEFSLDGMDSQPVSALLMTLPFLKNASRVLVKNCQERSWIDVTLHWLNSLGILIDHKKYHTFKIHPSQKHKNIHVSLDADFSSATYPMTYSLLHKKALKVVGLNKNSIHPDKGYFAILEKMGAEVNLDDGVVRAQQPLKGGRFNVNNCIDTLVLLCLVGCFCENPLCLTGAAVCRFKESNRIEAICQELTKMGARIWPRKDGCVIYPSRLRASDTSSHADHRIAMTLYLANKLCGFTTKIDNLYCIDKSYPNFIRDMDTL